MGKKWAQKTVPIFFKKNGQRKKKGGQKMGHQIGKDGISLKSKMNVLKSMVPSRQRHDLPTPGVPSNAAAGDVNPKISNRVRSAGPGLPVTFELNVFISCWPFSSSVYISQLIKYPTVGCPPASTPPHTPEQ